MDAPRLPQGNLWCSGWEKGEADIPAGRSGRFQGCVEFICLQTISAAEAGVAAAQPLVWPGSSFQGFMLVLFIRENTHRSICPPLSSLKLCFPVNFLPDLCLSKEGRGLVTPPASSEGRQSCFGFWRLRNAARPLCFSVELLQPPPFGSLAFNCLILDRNFLCFTL